MQELREAKRALLNGKPVIAIVKGSGRTLRIIQIRREESIYYGKAMDGVWWPITAVEVRP